MTNIKYNMRIMVYTLLASQVLSVVLGPMSMVYVCHSLSFARYQGILQIVSLCLWYGRYGNHNNIKGNLKYIALSLYLKTITHTGICPFVLWLSFSIDLSVNIIRTMRCNEFIRLLKILANTAAVKSLNFDLFL